ncbi:MAG: hypothetical protein MI921_29280 [Cytophagales bacterium]|nr:hypothetical protein [Cytophagales bacterium]
MNVKLTKEQKIKVANSEDVFSIMREVLKREKRLSRQKEHFWVIGLNVNNVIAYIELVALGSVSKIIVKPVEVFSFAVAKKCESVILVHNHPSGDLTPSKADIDLTKKLVNGSKFLEIKVLDHLIISTKEYLSFVDKKLLP